MGRGVKCGKCGCMAIDAPWDWNCPNCKPLGVEVSCSVCGCSTVNPPDDWECDCKKTDERLSRDEVVRLLIGMRKIIEEQMKLLVQMRADSTNGGFKNSVMSLLKMFADADCDLRVLVYENV